MNDREFLARLDARIRDFAGDLTKLEQAVSAVIVGRQFGWKVLLLVHDRKTTARYEETLDLDFRKELPAVGRWPESQAVGGGAEGRQLWKAVKGVYPNVKSVNVR